MTKCHNVIIIADCVCLSSGNYLPNYNNKLLKAVTVLHSFLLFPIWFSSFGKKFQRWRQRELQEFDWFSSSLTWKGKKNIGVGDTRSFILFFIFSFKRFLALSEKNCEWEKWGLPWGYLVAMSFALWPQEVKIKTLRSKIFY